MGKSVGYDTLVSDLRFALDLSDAEDVGNDRLSAAQASRLLNRSRDRLFAILAEEYGDDYFTFCVGVEVKPTVGDGQTIPLPTMSSATVDWWRLPETDAGEGVMWTPNTGTNEDATDAPAFHRLRKVQILDTYTAVDNTGTRLEPLFQWGDRPVDLERCGLDGLNRPAESRAWTTTDAPRYRLLGNQTLWFNRPSPADAGFLIWYVGNPLDISGTTHAHMGPGWAEYIVLDAAVWFAMRDRDGVSPLSVLKDERDRVEGAIRRQSGGRDEHGPAHVRRRYRNAYDLGASSEDTYDRNSYSRFR